MKKALIIFAIALCTCTLLSGNVAPPVQMKVGVNDIKGGTGGCIREEGQVGEIHIVDGYRSYFRPDGISDNNAPDRLDFPQMGRFH